MLYHEAAQVIEAASKSSDSLSSQVYGNKNLKSKPAQVYALVIEASKWSPLLCKVIEEAGLLQLERKVPSSRDRVNLPASADQSVSSHPH